MKRALRAGAVTAILLALLAFTGAPRGEAPQAPDAVELSLAEHLLHGLPHADISMSMPMQNVVSGLVFDHAAPWLRSWAPALLFLGSLVLVFTLGGLLHSPLCGALAVLLASRTLTFGVDFMAVYVFLVLLAANALVWAADGSDSRRWALAGVFIGVTFLQRSALFLFPAALAVSLVWRGRRWRAAAWAAAAPFALLAPWVWMNAQVSGSFVLFEDGRAVCNIVTGALGAVSTMEGEYPLLVPGLSGVRGALAWAAGEVLRHPGASLAAFALRLKLVLALHPALFLMAAAALWRFRRRLSFRSLGLLAAVYVVVHCLMPVKPSYFAALWPLLAVLAAAPLSALWGLADRLAAKRLCAAAAGSAGVLALGAAAYTLFIVSVYPGRAAADRLETALKADPDSACLNALWGERLLHAGKASAALAPLLRARDLDPRQDRALDAAAASLAVDSDRRGLIAALDAGAGTWRDQVRARLLRMLAALEAGRSPEARLEFAEAGRLYALRYAAALGSTPEDRRTQDRLSRVDPGLARGLRELLLPLPVEGQARLLARFSAAMGTDMPEASAVVAATLSAHWWLDQAEELERRGDREREVGFLARAAGSLLDEGAHDRLLSACRRLPDARAAGAVVDRLASRAGRDPDAALEAALFAAERGLRPQALRQLDRAAGGSLNAGQLRAGVAVCRALRDPRLTLAWLAKLARLAPDDPGVALEQAQACAEAGQTREAIRFLDGIGSPPASPEQIMSAAIQLQGLGQGEKGLALLDGLVRAHPGDARSLSNRGVAKAMLGRKEEAEKDLRSAVALDRRLLQSSLSLGVLYAGSGRRDLARAVYDEALAVRDPSDAKVRAMISAARAQLDAQ